MRLNILALLSLILLTTSLWAAPGGVKYAKTIVVGNVLKIDVPDSADIKGIKVLWPDDSDSGLSKAKNTWSGNWKVPVDFATGNYTVRLILEFNNDKEFGDIPVEVNIVDKPRQLSKAEKALAEKEAKALAKAEAEAKAKEEAKVQAEQKAKEAAEAKLQAKAEKEAKRQARLEAEAKAKAEEVALAQAQLEADAKAKSDKEAKIKAKAEAKAKAKAEKEALARAKAEAKDLAEAKARAEAEEKALALAQAKADEQARAEEEAQIRAEAEADARAIAAADAKAKAEEKAKAEAQRKALVKNVTEARSVAIAQAKTREAEQAEAEQAKVQNEAQLQAQEKADADAKARELAAEEAEALAVFQAEQKAQAAAKAQRIEDSEIQKTSGGQNLQSVPLVDEEALAMVAAAALVEKSEEAQWPPKTEAPKKQPAVKPLIKIEPVPAKNPAKAFIKPEERTINLDLRDVDLLTVLDLFSKQGGFNILADKTVTGKVSFSAKTIKILDAMDMVLKSNGYSWVKSNNNIIVTFKKPARTFILSYIRAENAQKAIKDLLPGIVGTSIDDRLNSITVRGNLADLEEAGSVIKDIDVRPMQVLVEAKVIEISVKDSPFLGAGIGYNNVQGNVNTAVDLKGLANAGSAAAVAATGATAGTKGFFAMVADSKLSSWIEALQTKTNSDLLANTKILATNNKAAKIITGEELGYTVRSVSTTGTLETVQFLTVGTQLEFTPQISQDGFITMIIRPEVSEGVIENSIPRKTTTEVTTEVTVRDGQSIVIGGLIRSKKTKTENGIPFLMDLPLMGTLFKSTSISDEKKETIVVITPHIINDQNNQRIEFKAPEPSVKGGLID
ncbi:MAG: secretin N-terminal domain-containing protein [Candidatus Margulisiibacteriota bacterium]